MIGGIIPIAIGLVAMLFLTTRDYRPAHTLATPSPPTSRPTQPASPSTEIPKKTGEETGAIPKRREFTQPKK